MVLVVEKKFLEETWWQYALGLSLLQVLFWILLGYKINPDFSALPALLESRVVITGFVLMACAPFIAGRLQLRSLYWAGLAGFLLGAFTYYALSLTGAGVRFDLLPFISFLQVYVSCFGLGVIVEFGRYVFRKMGE